MLWRVRYFWSWLRWSWIERHWPWVTRKRLNRERDGHVQEYFDREQQHLTRVRDLKVALAAFEGGAVERAQPMDHTTKTRMKNGLLGLDEQRERAERERENYAKLTETPWRVLTVFRKRFLNEMHRRGFKLAHELAKGLFQEALEQEVKRIGCNPSTAQQEVLRVLREALDTTEEVV